MRKIKYIVIHCSAGPDGVAKSLAQLTKEHQARGFRSIGYHYIISPDGTITVGRPEEEVGAHVQGFNSDSIGICMLGTLKFKQAAWDSLATLTRRLKAKYTQAVVRGHRDFSPDLNKDGKISRNEWIKLCPNFDVAEWMVGGMTPKLENLLP